MAHLDDFIKGIIDGSIATEASHKDEINNLIKVIDTEEAQIDGEFAKIGRLYYKLHPNRTEGELGALISGVNSAKKKIIDSKMRIGTLMDKTFCECCGEQVDEDALFCNNCGAKMPVKLMPGMILCKNCNKAVREGIKFCTNCGHSMLEEEKPKALKECTNCGFTTNDPDKMFCDDCGRRLVMEGGDPVEEKKEEKKVPTKKICTNCGFTIFDIDTMFCNDCGRRLVEASEVEIEE